MMLRFGSGFGIAAPRQAGSSVAKHPTKIRNCILVMRACFRGFTNYCADKVEVGKHQSSSGDEAEFKCSRW